MYKIDRKGNVKEHFDLGKYKNIDCFVSGKHNLSLSNIWLRAGGFYFAKNYHVGVRAERDSS